MSRVLDEMQRLLGEMNRAEKAQVLQWVARDLGESYPGIERRPEVAGDSPCIVRTRIPVWVLEQSRRLGASDANILQAFPTLRAEDLSNAWSYARAHGSEIEREIVENEEA